MARTNNNRTSKPVLKKGRPPTASKPVAKLSQKATNQIINGVHRLNKLLVKAELKGELDAATKIKKRLQDLGGLKAYQHASIQGQASDRGGDSSIVLVDWINSHLSDSETLEQSLRLLEVGSLSTQNVCSTCGIFKVTRIDLNSQAPGILQQDFMERPIPVSSAEKFDLISLSLVVNFVGDPAQRGEMLKRTLAFLDRSRTEEHASTGQLDIFPALFLVLPAPCVTNSRYMTEEQMTLIMASLGFVLLQRKQSAKLVYYLWLKRDNDVPSEQNFPKKLVKDGPTMNNFSIILREENAQ